MTGPTRPVGEVRADLVIDTKGTDKDVKDALDALGRDVDNDVKEVGEDWGEVLSEALSRKLKNEAPDITDRFSAELDRQSLKISKMTVQVDRNGNIVQRFITSIAQNAEEAIRKEAQQPGGGIFAPVRRAIGDAIGAGFNISGRSPLIIALIPLIGYIVALVIAAVQAINGLVAIILTLPSALLAVGFQVGVLMLAFEGVGAAIQGAFAAENAEQLAEAIKDLTPNAQEFVKSLLPIESIFDILKRGAQESFFSAFQALSGSSVGTGLQQLFELLQQPVIVNNVNKIADGLGRAADILLRAFSSREFVKLLEVLLPEIPKWVTDFALAIYWLITGISSLGTYLQPFFSWLGEALNRELGEFGKWLLNISKSTDFQDWLESAKQTLRDVWYLLGTIVEFVFVLLDQLDKAGGSSLIRTLGDQIAWLTSKLQDPFMQKALEGLIHLVELLAWAFIWAIAIILVWLGIMEIMAEFLRHGLPEVFTTVGKAIYDFFAMIGKAIMDFFTMIGKAIMDIWHGITGGTEAAFAAISSTMAAWFNYALYLFGSLPAIISNIFSDLAGLMYQLGANIIRGLINGILSMLGPLGSVVGKAAQIIKDYLPNSPAKEGPLSGEGDPTKVGQGIVNMLAEGIEMEGGTLASATNNAMSNVVFGAGAIQMTFNGPAPSQQQAFGIGTNVGNGISGILAQRDTRLAVRAMA